MRPSRFISLLMPARKILRQPPLQQRWLTRSRLRVPKALKLLSGYVMLALKAPYCSMGRRTRKRQNSSQKPGFNSRWEQGQLVFYYPENLFLGIRILTLSFLTLSENKAT